MLGCLSNLQIRASLSSFWWSEGESNSGFIITLQSHAVKSKHSCPIHAERTMCSYLQVRKWREASYSFFIYFFQVNKMSSGCFFPPQGYWQWAPRYKRLSLVHLWEEPEGCTRPRCPFSPSFHIDTTREEGMCGRNRTRVKERKRRVRRGNSGIGNSQVWGK